MTRAFALLVLLLILPRTVQAAGGKPYVIHVQGTVAGFRLAGIEPDGDPLDQVVLDTTLHPYAAVPRVHLIVDTYLENFQPDTTPILPDLLHPNQVAHNLGGFLQGKALITDNAGDVLYLGSFLAEAFLNNANHAVLTLDGSGPAYGTRVRMAGTFRLRHDGSLSGSFRGHLPLPLAALRQVVSHRNARMGPIKAILGTVTVRPHAMVGRATTKSSGVPLHTGFSRPSTSHASPFSLPTLAGVAAVLCLLTGLVLYVRERRELRSSPSERDQTS